MFFVCRWISKLVPIPISPSRRAPGSVAQDLRQELLAAIRVRLGDLAVAERQADPLHLAALVDRWEVVADAAVHGVLDGRREDLAVGHVVRPGRRLPRAPLGPQRQVGVRAHDPDLTTPFQPRP